MKRVILFFTGILFFSRAVFSQGVVNVNQVTGTAVVNIPIFSLSSGQVTVPLSLSYSASGVKTKDVENTAGMGWQLNAGGQISRVLRGLPDDCTNDMMGNNMLGWMSTSNSAANYAASFVPENTNTGATCTQQAYDINYIDTKMAYNEDTEPDLFYVNAPGLSCQLVWDRTHTKFQPTVYQDLAISYTVLGGTGYNKANITSFAITNDKGITYTFAAYNSVQQTTSSSTNPAYFFTQYRQYLHGIKYSDTWYLTNITDPYNNAVTLTYKPAMMRVGNDPVVLYLQNATVTAPQYTVQQQVTAQILNTMGTTSNLHAYIPLLTFNWTTLSGTGQTNQTFISNITYLASSFRTFNFTYNQVISQSSATNFTRSFLAGYSETGCSSPVNYQFGYIGQTTSGVTYYTTLPDSSSTYEDYWGYYSADANGGVLVPTIYVLNPNAGTTYPRYVIGASDPINNYSYLTLGSNSRSVTPLSVTTGALNQITYAAGGSTTLVYQSNDYYDVPTATTVQGGGIRVQQITDAPATGAANSIVRNYTYTNPGTSASSGEPITLPQYAFTIPTYTGMDTGTALWTDITAMSGYDLSTEDHTIMYANVTVSQSQLGSSVSNYSIAPTYFDNTFGTVDLVAQYNCGTQTYPPIQNYANSYPFIPNPNYDERGLLNNVTNYNTGGTEVNESDYTYLSNVTTPGTIQACKSDNMGLNTSQETKSYNVYPINYNVSSYTGSVTTKVYDSPTLSQAQTSAVSYQYSSAYPKMKQETATNSDGSQVNTFISYAKDFTAASSSSTGAVAAIYNLQQQNINIPIETYRQFTPSGGSATTTDASLSYFRDTTIASKLCVVPSAHYSWSQPTGGSFTPLAVTSSSITYSSNYIKYADYYFYDQTGFPLTADDNHRHIQTTILDHFSNQTTAVLKNAALNQIAFSDFDTDLNSVIPPCSTLLSPAAARSRQTAATPAMLTVWAPAKRLPRQQSRKTPSLKIIFFRYGRALRPLQAGP